MSIISRHWKNLRIDNTDGQMENVLDRWKMGGQKNEGAIVIQMIMIYVNLSNGLNESNVSVWVKQFKIYWGKIDKTWWLVYCGMILKPHFNGLESE